MELNDFNNLPIEKREEIVKQGVTNLVFLRVMYLVFSICMGLYIISLVITPYYNVWTAKMEAQAEVAKMQVLGECK